MKDLTFRYRCSECGQTFPIDADLMLCPACSKKGRPDKPLRGVLDVEITGEMSREEFLEQKDSIYRLLPCGREYFPKIPVGNTPMWESNRLRREHDLPKLFVKDDTRNPTGSLKDRASWLVSAVAKKYDRNSIVVASTGNAASSMAGIGAAAGQDITIFVPKTAPKAKLVQSLQYGARVIPVDGNYDMAFDISMKYSARTGCLSRNTAHNPMTIEGKKTAALEIFKDLGQLPDYVFIPVGDGVIISGVYKGFRDLMDLGITSRIPKIIGVQSEGSDAIYRSFKANAEPSWEKDFAEVVPTSTVADSICVDIPRNGYYALSMLRRYRGDVITVSDDKIIEAQRSLSSITGLFSEPAGATAYAGFIAYRDSIDDSSKVVLLVTGNGLKDIDGAMKGIDFPNRAIKDEQEADEF